MAVSDFLTGPIAEKNARAIPKLLSFDRSRRFAFTFAVVFIIPVLAIVPIISVFTVVSIIPVFAIVSALAIVPIITALATVPIVSAFAAVPVVTALATVPIVATFAIIPTVTITSRAALGMSERRDKRELPRKVCFQTIRKDREDRSHQ
ncbi:hypothetical protein OS190_19810 [Sulfitobacter sp. F26204]|nr:hypothetical protein [Sulfitobacter sp. F26204]